MESEYCRGFDDCVEACESGARSVLRYENDIINLSRILDVHGIHQHSYCEGFDDAMQFELGSSFSPAEKIAQQRYDRYMHKEVKSVSPSENQKGQTPAKQ